MELEYIGDIKDDVYNMISNENKRNPILKSCIARVIYENDYYMSDERPIERDCHYIAIGAYAIETNNFDELIDDIIQEIKRSIDAIESGEYDNELTEEDKRYIFEDIEKIKNKL